MKKIKCLLVAVLTLTSITPILANELSPAQDSFLEKQNDFNKIVYAHYSINAQHSHKGGFSRANFVALDATLSDVQNLAHVIEKRKLKVQVVCPNTGPASCAEKIIAKDLKVLPAITLLPFMQQTEEMKSLAFVNQSVGEKWKSQLLQLQLQVKENLGNDFIEFVIGYSDAINMYNYILISKDRTKAIILIGDAI